MSERLWLGFVAVGLGSAVGGWARWGLSVWLNPRHAYFYVGTFAANALGGLLVGISVAFFVKHTALAPEWRLLLVTGFLGGLTTFSTFSAEVIGLIERDEMGWAAVVAITHLATSFALTATGSWVYRSLSA